jgi:hypothetical protein
MARLTLRGDDYSPHWDEIVDPVTIDADHNERVVLYGHTYDTRYAKGDEREHILLRDGVEICRVSIFASGMPFILSNDYERIASTRRRSITVCYSLGHANMRWDGVGWKAR